MKLTKRSVNYIIEDTVNEATVTGNVDVLIDGTISITINIGSGNYASLTKHPDGKTDFNCSFDESNDLIDYAQSLSAQVFEQLKAEQ
jgi:hypothetical protein